MLGIGVMMSMAGLARVAAADGQGPVVHWPSDPNRLSGLEVEHVPVLNINDCSVAPDALELEVRVGKRLHPMSHRHTLRWLELFVNGRKVEEVRVYRTGILPVWRFCLVRTPSLRIVVRVACDVHGIWANRLIL